MKAEQPDHVQFNSQIIRQNEQQADSLKALNLENLFRKQKPDNQPISQQRSPACVSLNESVRVWPMNKEYYNLFDLKTTIIFFDSDDFNEDDDGSTVMFEENPRVSVPICEN